MSIVITSPVWVWAMFIAAPVPAPMMATAIGCCIFPWIHTFGWIADPCCKYRSFSGVLLRSLLASSVTKVSINSFHELRPRCFELSCDLSKFRLACFEISLRRCYDNNVLIKFLAASSLCGANSAPNFGAAVVNAAVLCEIIDFGLTQRNSGHFESWNLV